MVESSGLICRSCCIFREDEASLSQIQQMIETGGSLDLLTETKEGEMSTTTMEVHYYPARGGGVCCQGNRSRRQRDVGGGGEHSQQEDVLEEKQEGTRGYVCGTFDADEYFSHLRTHTLGRTLCTARQTLSTQTALQQNVAIIPPGMLFVADQQVGGKGRGKNTWSSPEGCLMFSMSCGFPGDGHKLPFVQYIVSLAIVQTVQAQAALKTRHIDSCRGKDFLNIKIKWPNDMYDGDTKLKIGGILCHSSFRQNTFHMTIGIGLNVDNHEPTTCLNQMLRSYANDAAVEPFTREELAAGVANRLESMVQALIEGGFETFESDYYAAWLHSGQRIRVRSEGDGLREIPVTIQGLSKQGYLLAQDAVGQSFELHPDGNSFDFLQGLVTKKI